MTITGTEEATAAKYAGADGALLWEKRYRRDAWFHSSRVDSADDVILYGLIYNASNGGSLTFYTVKAAAATGAPLWQKTYAGPDRPSWGPGGFAIDRTGNALVTGSILQSRTGSDIYTAKYAAGNGSLVWERRFTDRNSAPFDIAVDTVGNAIVTGRSGAGGENGQGSYTAKYAAADGALLWENRYRGPGGGGSSRVRVDRHDNAIVTGTYVKSDRTPDLYTAKYAAADGSLLWRRSLIEQAPGDDSSLTKSVVSLDLDAEGNVFMFTKFRDAAYVHIEARLSKYAAEDGRFSGRAGPMNPALHIHPWPWIARET